MKLTESHLRKIIRQELESVMKEGFLSDLFGGGKKKPASKPASTQPQYDELDALKAKNDARYAAQNAREQDDRYAAEDAKRKEDERKRLQADRDEQLRKYAANQGTVRRHGYSV